MKQILNTGQSVDLLCEADPTLTYTGARALVEWLEEVLGSDHELDPVAIRCDFTDYASAREAVEDYCTVSDLVDILDLDEEDLIEEECHDWLRERTTVIEHANGVVVANF